MAKNQPFLDQNCFLFCCLVSVLLRRDKQNYMITKENNIYQNAAVMF